MGIPSADPEPRHAAGEEDLVNLDPDHPGFRDIAYRGRRNAIARLALDYVVGAPIPRVAYTDDEHSVWRTVWAGLAPLHARYACQEYLDAAGAGGGVLLDRARIPQIADVNVRLEPLTGFRMIPVAGLVSSRAFLSRLGEGMFLSTQYIRHASRPLYTPEPDIVHELIGHAIPLCRPTFAALNRMFGAAAARVDDAALAQLERVYWYTMEFGLLRQGGGVKAYGAGLLSSFGELERFETSAEVRPLDLEECARRPYDPTSYQTVLYSISSLEALTRDVRAWLG